MGQCASVGSNSGFVDVNEYQPAPGTLVMVQVFASPKLQQGKPLYMVKAQDTWHSFSACGFLVEDRIIGKDRAWDVVLAGHLPAALPAQAANGHAVRMPFEDLLKHPEIKTIATAQLPPFTVTEVARMKSFTAKVLDRAGCGCRARLLASRGRKVFLPALIGEMLVSTGRMVKASDDMYSAAQGTWSMPDLVFLANLPSSIRRGSGSMDVARSNRQSSNSLPAQGAAGTVSSTRPRSHTARRQQQGVAHDIAMQKQQKQAESAARPSGSQDEAQISHCASPLTGVQAAKSACQQPESAPGMPAAATQQQPERGSSHLNVARMVVPVLHPEELLGSEQQATALCNAQTLPIAASCTSPATSTTALSGTTLESSLTMFSSGSSAQPSLKSSNPGAVPERSGTVVSSLAQSAQSLFSLASPWFASGANTSAKSNAGAVSMPALNALGLSEASTTSCGATSMPCLATAGAKTSSGMVGESGSQAPRLPQWDSVGSDVGAAKLQVWEEAEAASVSGLSAPLIRPCDKTKRAV